MPKYYFHEGRWGDGRLHYHWDKNDMVNEYFFSSTRKGYNHYGLIIRIIDEFQEEIEIDENKYTKFFKDADINIFRKDFDGLDFTSFNSHIKFLDLRINPADELWLINYTYIAKEIIIEVKSQNYQNKIGNIVSIEALRFLKEEFQFIKYFSHDYFAIFSFLEGIWIVEPEYKLLLFYNFKTLIQNYHYSDDLIHHAIFNRFIIDLNAFSKGIGEDFVLKQCPFSKIYADSKIEIFETDMPEEFEIDGLSIGLHKQTKIGLLINSKVGFNWWLFIPIFTETLKEELKSEVAEYLQSLAPDTHAGNIIHEYLANIT